MSFIPYRPPRVDADEMQERARALYAELDARRSVRDFSPEPVPRELIELAIKTACTAPSGAHRQPWKFVAVSDPAVKRAIRLAAEAEERQSYDHRMSQEWLSAIRPLGTTSEKPFLETAAWIVVVFEEIHGHDAASQVQKNYYTKESVGIACGLFITALHHMGLATLTHTPSPMEFLSHILQRPDNERPYLLFPVGYPARDAQVPDIQRKALDEVSVWIEPLEADRVDDRDGE